MRFVIRLLIVGAVLFCGWWALASYGVSQAINSWAEERRAQGWQVTADTAQGGFPLNIATQINSFEFADANNASTLSTQGARVSARTYWPGHVDIDLPQSPIVLTDGVAKTSVQTTDGQIALRLRPGFALELGSASLRTKAWAVQADETALLSGAAMMINARQDGDVAARYNLSLDAEAVMPGALARQLLSLPDQWPARFESFAATGAVTFAAPLTRSNLDGPRPQFRQITITEAVVIWGALSLNARGALDVDASGVPTGTLNIQAKDWRGLLDLAQQAGILPSDQRGQVELIMGLIAARSGDAANLDIDIAFQGGGMAVSGIPLGAAPRILWP